MRAVSESSYSARTDPKLTPSIDIVIVNWNSRSFLRQCLAALDQSTIAERLNTIVVDNASRDGSATGLSAKRMSLEVVINADNRGFAAACNQGARRAKASLLLFMNPDVRVEADALEKATAYMADRTHAGVAVHRIQLVHADGQVSRSWPRTPTTPELLLQSLFLDGLCPGLVPPHFLTNWDHSDTRTVDQIMGAFLMIRRALFEKIGGVDERFFLYYE